MISVPKDPNHDESSEPFRSLKNCAASQRALDYYLKPTVSASETPEKLFQVREDISAEEALVHASNLLSCAAAIAFESADNLLGASRDLAFSIVHMIDMAKAMIERSLATMPPREEP